MQNPADDNPITDNDKFDDLIVELYERRDSGEAIAPAVFIAEHPEFSEQLEQYFADVEAIELMAGPSAAEADGPDFQGPFITNDTHEVTMGETIVSDENGERLEAKARVSADSPLTEFGRYRILKELGRGAMGAVYLAHDEQLDREVALKIPQFGGEISEAMLERFYREARAAAALRHPGICPVHDVGEIDGQHYITMAYIQGRPLRDFTKSSKRLEDKQVARIIRKIALAMAEAHDHDVIHRDLKPANVMIDQRSEPVVMDFGLARRSVEGEERLTHTGTILGTPAYMSPEQVDGDNENVGAAADIYGLGVIFYEMLTGQLPFRGSLMSILKQIGSNDPQPPSELNESVDKSLEGICLKMLAKEVSDRPSSMMQVAESLDAWLQGRQSGVEESGVLETSRVPGQSGEQFTGLEETNPATVPGRARVETEAESFAALPDASQIAAGTPHSDRNQPPGHRKLLLAGGLILLLAGLTFFFRLGKYDVQVTLEDPSITLSVDDGALVISGTDSDTIRLTDGPHKLQAEIGEFMAELDEFTVKKDGKNVVHVAIVEGKPVFNPTDKTAIPRDLPTSNPKTSTPAPNVVMAATPSSAVAPFDAAAAKAHQATWAKHLGVPVEKEVELRDGELIRFMLVPPGEFKMGSTEEERRWADSEAQAASDTEASGLIRTEQPLHTVRITRPYYLAESELTNAQFMAIVPGNFSYAEKGLKHPLGRVSWDRAIVVVDGLNELRPEEGTFRLPTEAEWEYACRAGSEDWWAHGSDPTQLERFAWYAANAESKPREVKTRTPNAFGLHDMHGNVWEWCEDGFQSDYYERSDVADPCFRDPKIGVRVHRGGCCLSDAATCRSARRFGYPQSKRNSVVGMRVALQIDSDLPPPSATGSAVAPIDEAQAKQRQ